MSDLENAADLARGPGPWFRATRDGACSYCGTPFFMFASDIRADGFGSWEGRDCQDEHESDHEVTH